MLGLSAFSASEFIQTIVQTFTGWLTGAGSAIVGFFQTLFVTEEGNMTIFATVSLAFIGLSLAVGVARMIFKLIRR